MGTAGIIFGAIAVAWLVYLVPLIVRAKEAEVEQDDPAEPFRSTTTIIRRGDDEGFAVSTPFTRRAQLYALHQTDVGAARRRRRVLGTLLLLTVACGAVHFVTPLVPLWTAAVPAGLAAVFLFIARFSVKAMRRDLNERRAEVLDAFGDDEDTVVLRMETPRTAGAAPISWEHSVELGTTVRTPGSLWDPVPVTLPTYVTKPLAPRTVRTIDLSAPDVQSSGRRPVPVSAGAQPVADDAEDALRRAVGE